MAKHRYVQTVGFDRFTELLQQLPSPDTLLALNVEFLHAHEQPSRLIDADAPVLDYETLAQDQVMAVCKLLVERDGRVGASKLAAQLEFGERCEQKRCCIFVGVCELEVVKLSGLLSLAGLRALGLLDRYLPRHR